MFATGKVMGNSRRARPE